MPEDAARLTQLRAWLRRTARRRALTPEDLTALGPIAPPGASAAWRDADPQPVRALVRAAIACLDPRQFPVLARRVGVEPRALKRLPFEVRWALFGEAVTHDGPLSVRRVRDARGRPGLVLSVGAPLPARTLRLLWGGSTVEVDLGADLEKVVLPSVVRQVRRWATALRQARDTLAAAPALAGLATSARRRGRPRGTSGPRTVRFLSRANREDVVRELRRVRLTYGAKPAAILNGDFDKSLIRDAPAARAVLHMVRQTKHPARTLRRLLASVPQ